MTSAPRPVRRPFTVAATVYLMWGEETIRLGEAAILAGGILATTLVWGGLFENRRWAVPLELARLAAILSGVVWCSMYGRVELPVAFATVVAAAACAAWLLRRPPAARNRSERAPVY